MNLLEETLEVLADYDLTEADVLWVGTHEETISWEAFKKAADFEYDDGFGINEVRGDLRVVGEDWWLTRGEYDGSEWWDFHRKPEKPALIKDDLMLKTRWCGCGWWKDVR